MKQKKHTHGKGDGFFRNLGGKTLLGVPVTKPWKSRFCGSFRLKVGWFSEFLSFFLPGVARRFGSRKSSSLSHWCAWSNGAPEVWETQYFGMVGLGVIDQSS